MKEISAGSKILVAGIIFFIIIIGTFFYRTRVYNSPVDYELTEITLVQDSVSETDGTRTITGHFSSDISEGDVLYFWPENIEVTMLVNGQVIYSFQNEHSDISSTPGCTIARVSVDEIDEDDIITLKLVNPWYEYEADNSSMDKFMELFAVGSPKAIYEYMLRGNFVGIGSGLLMVFIGFLFLIYTLIYYYKRYDEASLNLAFAFLCMCSGLFETNGATDRLLALVVTNPVWCSLIKLFSYYLFVISVEVYLRAIAKSRWARILQTLLVALSIAFIVIATVQSIFGFYDIYMTDLYLSKIFIGLLAVSSLATIIDGIINKSEQLIRVLVGLMPVLFAVLLITAIKLMTGTIFQDPLYLSAIICIIIVAFAIIADGRTAERALAWMNKQIIKSNGELNSTIENLSISKRQNAKLAAEKELLEAQNQVDIMTGLFNKVAMRQVVDRYLKNNNTVGVALIFIDLDHFKSLNDTLGHSVGDQAIRDAAAKLSTTFRRYDLVSRFGGDEFCVFLRNIKHDDLVNKLALLVDVLKADYTDGNNTVHITGSVGCVHVMSEYADYNLLLEAADRSVYEAKTGGRNRYVLNEYVSPARPEAEE